MRQTLPFLALQASGCWASVLLGTGCLSPRCKLLSSFLRSVSTTARGTSLALTPPSRITPAVNLITVVAASSLGPLVRETLNS